MTVKEYISQKLQAFEITEAQLCDVSFNISLDDEYTTSNADAVGKALVSAIEDLLFSPRRTSISEGGFSVAWNYADLGKYYMYLCRKFACTPNDDILTMLNVNSITDKTDIW